MTIDYAVRVEKGKKETNDDRVFLDGNIFNENAKEGKIELPFAAVLCDGCGGYYGGNIAAETVINIFAEEKAEEMTEVNYLNSVLEKCQTAVTNKKKELPQYSEMCTTIAGCVFSEEGIMIFHSGDSRVYRNDRYTLARMTKDHSIVQEMVDNGELSPEEARNHPRRNVITQCIGVGSKNPEIYVSRTMIYPGDRYLICSDGLWEKIEDKEIKELLDSDLPLGEIVDLLIEKALNNGADDNISVCICSREGEVSEKESTPFILD